ncbi:MAG: DMT family transporter [Lachnospiraceae bacterium]
MKNNIKGSLILLLTALIWGTAFVAQTSGSDHVGTFTFNACRCFVGAAFLGGYLLIRGRVQKKTVQKSTQQSSHQEYIPTKWPIVGGILCGCVLCMAMSFQQAGISAYPDGVAASGRSGFLTATYVVMVAIGAALTGKKPHILVILSVVGTICGMYLLCMASGFSGIYIGDVLELICAVCFTAHILVIDRYAQVDSVKLSCIQFLTSGVISMILCLFFEGIKFQDIRSALIPILYAGVMSSGVAYTLQMVGQKYAEPAVASIVMSLESVFAALSGALILHEVLSGREIMGCILVFVSVILAQMPQFLQQNQPVKAEK